MSFCDECNHVWGLPVRWQDYVRAVLNNGRYLPSPEIERAIRHRLEELLEKLIGARSSIGAIEALEDMGGSIHLTMRAGVVLTVDPEELLR